MCVCVCTSRMQPTCTRSTNLHTALWFIPQAACDYRWDIRSHPIYREDMTLSMINCQVQKRERKNRSISVARPSLPSTNLSSCPVPFTWGGGVASVTLPYIGPRGGSLKRESQAWGEGEKDFTFHLLEGGQIGRASCRERV